MNHRLRKLCSLRRRLILAFKVVEVPNLKTLIFDIKDKTARALRKSKKERAELS